MYLLVTHNDSVLGVFDHVPSKAERIKACRKRSGRPLPYTKLERWTVNGDLIDSRIVQHSVDPSAVSLGCGEPMVK